MGLVPFGLSSLFSSDWTRTAFSVSVCIICSILLVCLCPVWIAYRLFMTVKSKKSRWARTVIIVENGAQ